MSKSSSITAYFLRVDDKSQQYQGYMAEVPNSLKAEQEYVGGYVQVIALTDEIDAIINDDGKLMQLPANRLWKSDNQIYDFIVGNIQCVRHNIEGEFTNIQPEDIEVIEKLLVPIKGMHLVDEHMVFITVPAEGLPEWKGEENVS